MRGREVGREGLHEQSIKINQVTYLMLGPKVLDSLFQILHFGS